MKIKEIKKKNKVVTSNIFEQQEMLAKAESIKNSVKVLTWHELETKGKNGNFGMPYLPEGYYADLLRLSMFRDQLNKDRNR